MGKYRRYYGAIAIPSRFPLKKYGIILHNYRYFYLENSVDFFMNSSIMRYNLIINGMMIIISFSIF